MKKRLQGLVAGILIGTTVTGGTVIATNTTTLYDVIANGVKIVVDGQKLNPTDAQGNKVEPIIYNGTTYLPVRAVANALGKAVYWDGPNTTVYLGEMGGALKYPTTEICDLDNLGSTFRIAGADKLMDNYGNPYANAIYSANYSGKFETILNMKYSKFKCTIYTPKGYSKDRSTKISIKTDGKTIYTSPELTKTSRPINVDVDIRGCNVFEIETSGDSLSNGFIGNAGFYQ